MRYNLVTLGCQMNKSDSERFRTVIDGMGYKWTDNEEEADLLGVLACSVRQKSIDKVFSRIYKWNKWKNSKNLITFLSGCILKADEGRFLKLFDLVFNISDLQHLPEMIRQYGIVTPTSKQNIYTGEKQDLSRPEERIREFWDISPSYISFFEAFIPIQNGCDKFCTFCAVPYTRGREISRPSAEILDEIKYLVNRGYKSITLLGQNVNSYGLDKKGDEISFAQLLGNIGEFGRSSGRDFWVYFTSPHPRDMTAEVIDIIAEYRCLANHIHLPLQSGDNSILKKMNRNHTVEQYREIIKLARKRLPGVTIFTDIIVGFAGETEAQFENTRKIMEELKFNIAYIARYSPRPGAVSSGWTDNIPAEIKKQRLHILTSELKKHSKGYNKQLIDNNIKVLVTGADRKQGYLSGITKGKIIIRFKSDDISLIGSFVYITVTSAAEFAAEGDLVYKAKAEPAKL
jgi:tRNA-2-methylthio-N6-dimethylallyladenosine synthase